MKTLYLMYITVETYFYSFQMAPASGKFSFSAPAPAFDANAKPTFNFTAGSNVPSFT